MLLAALAVEHVERSSLGGSSGHVTVLFPPRNLLLVLVIGRARIVSGCPGAGFP